MQDSTSTGVFNGGRRTWTHVVEVAVAAAVVVVVVAVVVVAGKYYYCCCCASTGRDNVAETPEGRGGAYMGFSERLDTILK